VGANGAASEGKGRKEAVAIAISGQHMAGSQLAVGIAGADLRPNTPAARQKSPSARDGHLNEGVEVRQRESGRVQILTRLRL